MFAVGTCRTLTKRNTRDDCEVLAYVMAALIGLAHLSDGGFSWCLLVYLVAPTVLLRTERTQQHQLELCKSRASRPLTLLHPGRHDGGDAALSGVGYSRLGGGRVEAVEAGDKLSRAVGISGCGRGYVRGVVLR